MKTPSMFSGVLRCTDCRRSWGTTWNTQAPVLICHECGGPCLPEGPQLVTEVCASAIDGEMFRLERRAVTRTRS